MFCAYGLALQEVLSCDDIPDLDFGIGCHSDVFVAIVFEDKLVRTDVIFDCPSPRWPPWSSRAFVFPIKHPSSVLTIGVFDYDEGPLVSHDPAGRIVIEPSNFDTDTVYTLQYKLQSDAGMNDVSSLSLTSHVATLLTITAHLPLKQPVVYRFIWCSHICIRIKERSGFALENI